MSKMCVICGKDLGWLSLKTSISDGVVCADCLDQAGIKNLSNTEMLNTDSLKELLDRRVDIVNLFSSTKKVGKFMEIDENHKLFKICGAISGGDIFEYANLLSFELLENGDVVSKGGGLGRAVAGGLLFGGTGAIVGGVTAGKKSKSVCDSMKLRITLKNAHTDNVFIEIIKSKTEIRSIVYENAQKKAQDYISALEIIADQNESEEMDVKTQSSFSIADEIIKLKQLLDAGILTQEEFDVAKKKLLGLY